VGSGAGDGNGPLAALTTQFETEFRAALDDDLNAPRACAALFSFVHEGHGALDARAPGARVALGALERAMDVLDTLPTQRPTDPTLERWITERVAARDKARQAKDFSAADRIRAELKAKGVEIDDGPGATTWRRV
jgi:cysteinyl-tRNA synthetase